MTFLLLNSDDMKGYKTIPLTFNRLAVIASATVTKEKNTIHCITEADITEVRSLIRKRFTETGEKLSLTAYIVKCLAQAIADHPSMNSFIKGRRLVILDDVTISVLVERERSGEKKFLSLMRSQLHRIRISSK